MEDSMKWAIFFVVSLIVGVVLVAQCTANVSGANYEAADQEAHKFAKTIYGEKLRTVTCARADSDGDGYVSCTLSYEENKETKVQAIECAVAITTNEGCRIQRASIPRN
jgi:flagellar basal body-associated protein FliL